MSDGIYRHETSAEALTHNHLVTLVLIGGDHDLLSGMIDRCPPEEMYLWTGMQATLARGWTVQVPVNYEPPPVLFAASFWTLFNHQAEPMAVEAVRRYEAMPDRGPVADAYLRNWRMLRDTLPKLMDALPPEIFTASAGAD